jgi:hypothetical protein
LADIAVFHVENPEVRQAGLAGGRADGFAHRPRLDHRLTRLPTNSLSAVPIAPPPNKPADYAAAYRGQDDIKDGQFNWPGPLSDSIVD